MTLLRQTGSRTIKTIVRLFQVVVLLAVFFFLGRNLYQSWGKLVAYRWRPDVLLLLLSLVLMILCGLLVGGGWNLILRALGKPLRLGAALRIYFLSELGKYLPGKIWTVMGRIFLAEKEGVPKLLTAASVGTMLIIMVISGMLVAAFSLPAWPTLEMAVRFNYLFLLLPVGLLALHPVIFNPFVNWALKRIERAAFTVRLRYGPILLIVLFWCLLWLVKGAGMYVLLVSLYHEPLPELSWLSLTGVVAISWVAGTLSLIAPAGLGVTEVVLVLLLGSLFSIEAGMATALALFSRVWGVIAELICIGITFKLK